MPTLNATILARLGWSWKDSGALSVVRNDAQVEYRCSFSDSLDAARAAPDPAGCYLQFRTVNGKAKARVRRLNEARMVAELVRRLVEERTPVTDPGTGQLRPLRYGDVAVLARGSAPFETVASVLPSLGVPAVEV